MKQVFQTSNSPEAHMIAHLLEQEGIEVFVQGEMLQGAVGELPVDGHIKVTVANPDYQKAIKIISEWESKNPMPKNDFSETNSSKGLSLFDTSCFLIIGLIIGYFANEFLPDGIFSNFDKTGALKNEKDRNRDGIPDLIYYYDSPEDSYPRIFEEDANFDGKMDVIVEYNSKGDPVSDKIDMNFDGQFDLMTKYNRRGHRESDKQDIDFDGEFETRVIYKHNFPIRFEVDADQDGQKDFIDIYENGAILRTDFYDAEKGKLFKVNNYKNYRLVSSQIDSDGDGTLDTKNTYDRYEELIKSEKLTTYNK